MYTTPPRIPMDILSRLHRCFDLLWRVVNASQSRLAIWIASIGLFCVGPLTDCCTAIEFRTVALEGQAAPGTLAGVTFNQFFAPSLNKSGKVSFSAFLTGNGVNTTNVQGIWSDRFGDLSMIVRKGDQVPSEPANTKFDRFGFTPLLNDRGHIAFNSLITGIEPNIATFHGIWTAMDNGITKVARINESVLSAPSGTVFQNFRDRLLFNNEDTIGFTSTLFRPGDIPPDYLPDNYDAAFSATPGSTSVIAGLTTNFPNLPPGTTFYSATSVALNDIGRSLVYVLFERNGVPDSNYGGLFLGEAGSLQLVARSEGLAPGFTGSVSFANPDRPSALSNAGRVAFGGTLSGADSGGTNWTGEQGIWSDRGGSLTLIVSKNTPLQSGLANLKLIEFGDIAINDNGLIAFEGRLAGPGIDLGNDNGIWVDKGINGPLLVAREGAVYLECPAISSLKQFRIQR